QFEPCYMLHVVNTYEHGDWVVMIGCRTRDPSLSPKREDGKLAAMLSGLKLQANLYEWRMNLKSGEVREGPLDDLNAEFPMIRADRTGRSCRFSYHQIIPYEVPATFEGLVKYDLSTGAYTRFDYGAGVFGSEAPFAARTESPDADEDDGYVVTFVTDRADWTSAVWVFDAKRIEAGPIAKVRVPGRIPAGFHATWVAGDDLPS
ncbi:MAG: carotenoid oxygenase family protein, partial [Myxococcota bacterium]